MNRRAQEAVGTSTTKKQVYIAGIVIALVVILILVYFGGKQFAGKAIALPTTLGVGEAGILGTEISGGVLSVGIGANIGAAESVAFEFELTYPGTVNPVGSLASTFVPGKDWGSDAFSRITQVDSDTIKVEYATLDYRNALTGAVTLGEVKFSGEVGNVLATDFTVRNLRVWSIPDGPTEPITNLAPTIITPAGETACVQPLADAALCGSFCALSDSRTTYCDYGNQCGGYCPSQDVGPDLNGDGVVNDGDIIIIQLAMLAKESRYSTCGGTGQQSCQFPGVYVCENLESSYTEGITSCG